MTEFADIFLMETVSLDAIRVSQEAIEALPRHLAERYHVFPIEIDSGQLTLAVSNSIDVDSVDSLSYVLKRTLSLRLAPQEEIDAAIHQYYENRQEKVVGGSAVATEAVATEAVVSLAVKLEESQEEDAPIVRYVHRLIMEAIQVRASDIHLEPLEEWLRIRYRIDGVLREVGRLPKRLQSSILSYLKLMANINIAEKRLPQDGRIQMQAEGRAVDLRVSSLPTVFGESIVLRLLDRESLKLGFPELGFFNDDVTAFERLIALPNGIILVTGPTGSGKSTTLYSALNTLNQPDRKIITVEDPIEYQMLGVNQVPVRKDVGMTFAKALRSILRQAPNIIMVGEIRDLETAEIALNASLTGHMVFSTLHTNDAPGAVTRLVDIGLKPFLVSASLRGVLAQRLVRRLCPHCKRPHAPRRQALATMGISSNDRLAAHTFFESEGCAQCGGSGFKGRLGIFEMLVVNETIQQMIYEGRSRLELLRKARGLGMRTMREDGWQKVAAGLTTIEEILAVTVAESSI